MGFFSIIKKVWAGEKPAASLPPEEAQDSPRDIPAQEAAPEQTPPPLPQEPDVPPVADVSMADDPIREEGVASAVPAVEEDGAESVAPQHTEITLETALAVHPVAEEVVAPAVPEGEDAPVVEVAAAREEAVAEEAVAEEAVSGEMEPPSMQADAPLEAQVAPLAEAVQRGPATPGEDAAEQESVGSTDAPVAPETVASPEPAAAPEMPQPPARNEEAPQADPAPRKGFFARLFGRSEESPSSAPAMEQPAPEAADGEAPAAGEGDASSARFQDALILKLREAEPRLSVWLSIILDGIETADDALWERLAFLLRSLEAPETEVQAFIEDFRAWLRRMEYSHVEEFRSELQYRLALALELEDEEDERSRLFLKLSEGLARTREHFSRRMEALFASHSALDDAFWEEMEELFIMADVGYEPARRLVERLQERVREEGVTEPSDVRRLLQEEVRDIFRTSRRISAVNPPEVVLMIGVNGVGKTTTIAKLAHRARMQGRKVLIAAADTFRAAAIEQLGVWAQRVGADFYAKTQGADPAAVAYEAVERAVSGGYDLLFVDTAGRLQTKVNLMEELAKIRQVLGKKHPGAPHRSVLVIDATTGQNALSQAKLFKEKAGLDEIILTKLDGTAKGGVAIAVAMQFEVPITYIGLGEKLEDLRPFKGEDFALALLGEHGDVVQ